jgi:hypothetical protein
MIRRILLEVAYFKRQESPGTRGRDILLHFEEVSDYPE